MKPTPTSPIGLFKVHMPESVDVPLLDVLHSGYIGEGPQVKAFEHLWRERLNRMVLTVNSGTSALTLAMRLCDAEHGEVISTAMTCTATNTPILDNRAKPVWADVDPATGLIDPDSVRKKINAKTRAIVCVHWGGTPCDMDALMAISKEFGIPVIEDAAHAIGAEGIYRGHFIAHSFQAIKHITTVDGGLLVFSEPYDKQIEDYDRAKLLRWYGIDRENTSGRSDLRCEANVEEWGWKMHMNDVAATIGIAQMPHLDAIVDKHRANAKAYYEGIAHKNLQPAFPEKELDRSSFWLYTLLCPSEQERDAFMGYMKECGIMASKVHSRNDTHTMFAASKAELPGVDEFYSREVCIPVHWGLTEQERKYIIDCCNKWQARRKAA